MVLRLPGFNQPLIPQKSKITHTRPNIMETAERSSAEGQQQNASHSDLRADHLRTHLQTHFSWHSRCGYCESGPSNHIPKCRGSVLFHSAFSSSVEGCHGCEGETSEGTEEPLSKYLDLFAVEVVVCSQQNSFSIHTFLSSVYRNRWICITFVVDSHWNWNTLWAPFWCCARLPHKQKTQNQNLNYRWLENCDF